MNDKPYVDHREQSVRDDLPVDHVEQARRMAAIEAVGYLVQQYGTAGVLAWAVKVPPDARIAPLVEDFGVDLVARWIKYFGWMEGGGR